VAFSDYDTHQCLYSLPFFYKKQLLNYDTLLYSVHFTSFFLILYSIFLLEILWLFKLNVTLLLILIVLNLLALSAYLATSLKRVFSFSWPATLLRMLAAGLLSFTVYQLIHYAISLNSGR
jgi:hypothetical protein